MLKTFMTAGALAACLAGSAARINAADAATALLPAAAVIHIKDFKYNPTPVAIHTGDRVTFINDDDEAHTATSTDKSFDSAGLDSGQTWQHVFTKPGTYDYFCELHPYMKATIVVLPSGAGAQH